MWSSRLGTLEQPDWMILDLDPKGAPFANVVRMAKVLKEILDELDLPGFPKTSGASGLHILVPLGARYTYEQSRAFARLLAMLAVQREPEISTIVRAVQARGGKVYVDWGQNGHGQSIVSPFCVRPLPGAPVSCPLEWKEVNAKLDPAKWTIKTVPPRFNRMKDPLLGVFGKGIAMAGAIGKLEGMLKRE
jgi:bifunctional non-homologous end joining protein LigD